MKKFLTFITTCLVFGFAGSAHADSKWLKWVNDHNEKGVVRSAVGTAIVGNTEIFMFVDTYPDLATWAAVKQMLDSDEGNELEGMFNETSECSSNRLWNMQETK